MRIALTFGNGGDDLPGWVAIGLLVGVTILVPVTIGVALRLRDRDRGSTDSGPADRPGSPSFLQGWGYPERELEPRVVWGRLLIAAATLGVLYLIFWEP